MNFGTRGYHRKKGNILTRYSLKGLRSCLFPLGKLLRLPVKSKNHIKGNKCCGMTQESPHCLLPEGRFKGAPECAHSKSCQHSLRFTCKNQTNVLEMREVKYLVL